MANTAFDAPSAGTVRRRGGESDGSDRVGGAGPSRVHAPAGMSGAMTRALTTAPSTEPRA